MYEKLIDSPDIEEKKIRHVEKTKTLKNKQTEKSWIATDAEHPIGSNSMIVRHEERSGRSVVTHCYRSRRKINNIAEKDP